LLWFGLVRYTREASGKCSFKAALKLPTAPREFDYMKNLCRNLGLPAGIVLGIVKNFTLSFFADFFVHRREKIFQCPEAAVVVVEPRAPDFPFVGKLCVVESVKIGEQYIIELRSVSPHFDKLDVIDVGQAEPSKPV
jgi:hypothetical protein